MCQRVRVCSGEWSVYLSISRSTPYRCVSVPRYIDHVVCEWHVLPSGVIETTVDVDDVGRGRHAGRGRGWRRQFARDVPLEAGGSGMGSPSSTATVHGVMSTATATQPRGHTTTANDHTTTYGSNSTTHATYCTTHTPRPPCPRHVLGRVLIEHAPAVIGGDTSG